jgi:hypothetical protein
VQTESNCWTHTFDDTISSAKALFTGNPIRLHGNEHATNFINLFNPVGYRKGCQNDAMFGFNIASPNIASNERQRARIGLMNNMSDQDCRQQTQNGDFDGVLGIGIRGPQDNNDCCDVGAGFTVFFVSNANNYNQKGRNSVVKAWISVKSFATWSDTDREESEHWVKLLEDASYGGKWQKEGGYAPLATGRFSKLKAVYKRGKISCNAGDPNSIFKWQTCNPQFGGLNEFSECASRHCPVPGCLTDSGCFTFELLKDGAYVVEQRNALRLPAECVIPSTPTGDIICTVDFSVESSNRLTPTWYEPSHRSSTRDNAGDIVIDLYGLPAYKWSDWPPCPVTCGGGQQTRTCEKGDCKGLTSQTCNTLPCLHLTIAIPVADREATADEKFNFVVPANTFSKPNLKFNASLESGQPLPHWLVFNSASRKFIGYPKPGDVGELLIKIVGNDGTDEVSEVFSLIISKPSETSPSAAAAPSDPVVPVSVWIVLSAALLVAASCYLGKRCERRKLSSETKIEMEGLVVRPSDEGIVQSHVQPGMHF